MYIKYNNNVYNCECRISNTSIVYSKLPEDFPVSVSGEVILCSDDGFVMRTDNVGDYLRYNVQDGVLTLTNTPEPEEDDVSNTANRTDWGEMALAINTLLGEGEEEQ